MGVVVKQSFWGTVIAYLGVVIGYVNTLYFRAEYLDLGQIGLFTLITANAMMVSPLSSLGLASTFVKYFPSFKNNEKEQFFSFLFLITLLGNAIVLLCGFALKDAIAARYVETAPAYIDYLLVTGVIVVANSMFELFFSYSRTILKVVFPSFLRDVYLRFGSLLMVIGFAMNWWSFDGAVLGLGIVYFLAFVFLFIQLIAFHGFRFHFNFGVITPIWRKKLINFGAYSMLLAASFAVINNATYDQITAILGPDINGIFNTCFFIAVIVEMPRRNMAKVIGPILSSEFEQQNMEEVGSLYKRSSITMTVIGMLLFIGIVTNLSDLFAFIPKGGEFEAGFWVVVGVCFAKLVVMAHGFAGEIINYSERYKYNLFFQVIAAIILIVLNYLLIPLWGINGAVISYLSTIVLHIILKVGFVYRYFHIHPFIRSHVPLLIIGIAVCLIAFILPLSFHPVVNILVRSVITSLLFVVLIYYFHISIDINKIIRSTFERFLNIKLPK